MGNTYPNLASRIALSFYAIRHNCSLQQLRNVLASIILHTGGKCLSFAFVVLKSGENRRAASLRPSISRNIGLKHKHGPSEYRILAVSEDTLEQTDAQNGRLAAASPKLQDYDRVEECHLSVTGAVHGLTDTKTNLHLQIVREILSMGVHRSNHHHSSPQYRRS